jgi:hypothetical protein
VRYRLHFTDASLAQMEQLGLDQDAVRTVINAGTKIQEGENLLLCRHKAVEILVAIDGPDYEVRALQREVAWPRAAPEHAYVRKMDGA